MITDDQILGHAWFDGDFGSGGDGATWRAAETIRTRRRKDWVAARRAEHNL